MKRGWIILLTLIILSIVFVTISFLNAATQSASSIVINIDGTVKNLDAQSNYFYGTHTYSSVSVKSIGQHDASEIWVSVASGEMTLLEALQKNKLCPKNTKPMRYTSLNIPNPSHLATEISLSSGKSLQGAINEGKFNSTYFECKDNDAYGRDSCGSFQATKIQECGDSSCGGWGSTYYSLGRQYQDRTCHDKGCSNGACFDTVRTETRDVTPAETESHGDHETTTTTTTTTTTDYSNLPDRIAGDGGGGGGGKVICTELYNTGLMDKETYDMDVEYAKTHFSREALTGYQAWAISVVKAMRKSPEVKEKVVPLVNNFMQEIAYRSGKSETGNEVGKLLLDEGIPLFERVGKYIDEPDWKDLFIDKSLFSYITSLFQKESEYDRLVRNYFTEEKVREMIDYAEAKGGDSQIAFAKTVIENLEKNVEEVESLIKENGKE